MLNECLKDYFMGSQLWNCVNIYVTWFVPLFPPQKNSCFSSQKCLGINASELQFYMKYLIFFIFDVLYETTWP